MSEWQPIETAPKDGQQLMLHLQNGDIIIASSDIANAAVVQRKEMYIQFRVWPDAGYLPTHWMPLPPPPQEQPNDR